MEWKHIEIPRKEARGFLGHRKIRWEKRDQLSDRGKRKSNERKAMEEEVSLGDGKERARGVTAIILPF